MSASNTVAWFEIGAPDVDAAKAFYGPLFGWSFAADGPYTLITAPGAAGPSGGIFNTGGSIPPYAVFVVQVADVAATAAQAEQLGGKVVVAPNKLDDGMVVAYLTDPHGSMFALFSPAPAAERPRPGPPGLSSPEPDLTLRSPGSAYRAAGDPWPALSPGSPAGASRASRNRLALADPDWKVMAETGPSRAISGLRSLAPTARGGSSCDVTVRDTAVAHRSGAIAVGRHKPGPATRATSWGLVRARGRFGTAAGKSYATAQSHRVSRA